MKEEISKAAEIIRNGGVVAFPTETVYGLGANALNPLAVARIFELKERPTFDPLIVHIASMEALDQLTSGVGENVRKLAEKFWPGPLTMVLPKSDIVPDLVTSGLETVGIRMPSNPLALSMIRESGCPVAAPSANKFGQLSPVCAEHVRKQLPDVDYVLDGGFTTVGIESTIVSIEGDVCRLLRPGFITLEDIEEALPGVFQCTREAQDKLIAPGLLKSHYAPRKPLYIIDDVHALLPPASGLILHGKTQTEVAASRVVYTSENHSKTAIAAGLFAALHTMEEDPAVEQIFIETVEESGLGLAIMDRLKKAAYKYQPVQD